MVRLTNKMTMGRARDKEMDKAQENLGRQTARMRYEDVDGSFRKFAGADDQNIFAWMESFDTMCAEAKWNEFEKLTYLRRSIKDVAYDLALLDGGNSYESVKEVLLAEFGNDWKPGRAVRRIMKRRKKPDETPIQYMNDMRRLGNAAGLDNASIAMFAVDGLNVEPIWKFVLSRITDLVELRLAMEDADRYAKESAPDQKESTTTVEGNEERRRCFSCNEIGHLAMDCTRRFSHGGGLAVSDQKKKTTIETPTPRSSECDATEVQEGTRGCDNIMSREGMI